MKTMDTGIPGQQTLPELANDFGFESATLKPSWERFCWEYVLRNGSGTDAYVAAFPGVSRKSANANAARLLKNEAIQKRIEQVKAELQRKYSVSAGSLIFYLSQVLNIDRGEFLDDHGDVRPVSDITTEARKILDIDFQLDRNGKQRAVYRIPAKLQAAVELARMMGLHKDRVELIGESATPESSLSALLREIDGDSSNPTDAKTMSTIERANRVAALLHKAKQLQECTANEESEHQAKFDLLREKLKQYQ